MVIFTTQLLQIFFFQHFEANSNCLCMCGESRANTISISPLVYLFSLGCLPAFGVSNHVSARARPHSSTFLNWNANCVIHVNGRHSTWLKAISSSNERGNETFSQYNRIGRLWLGDLSYFGRWLCCCCLIVCLSFSWWCIQAWPSISCVLHGWNVSVLLDKQRRRLTDLINI